MSDIIAINTNGLEEAIRCAICENPIKSEHGCDGSCKYDEKLLKRIIEAILWCRVERPHGEWIGESKDALKCSACGKWVYKPFIGGFPTERTQHYNHNYCAFCGADMRKEGEAE